ncbi:DUF2125 domain-containing protein [Devosia chinhatensis]|nr:DUF2125 domain-containing protein [Devosia chinhatensis]
MKKRIIILGAIVLVVVLGWSAAWYFIAGQIRQQVDIMALADGETAPRLTCETLSTGGFPFRFELECRGATLVSGDMLIALPAWRASAMAYRPNHVLASANGPAQISDAFTGMRQDISWTDLNASMRLENWRIARLSIVGDDLAWSDSLFGTSMIASSPHVEVHLLDIAERHNQEARRSALALFARFDAVVAPAIAIEAANAEIEAEIDGLPDDVRNWGLVPFLPDWQQAGGSLNLVAMRASDATSDLSASGRLALDAQGYPEGAITIDSIGVAERIGPLIEEPWRTLVLGVPGPNGRHANQLNFAGGSLSSGLVPIAQLEPLF